MSPKFENQGTLTSSFGPRRNLRSPSPVGPGGVVSAIVTKVHDTFGGGNDSDIDGRTPDTVSSGNWVKGPQGAIGISSGAAIMAASAAQSAWYYVESSVSNFTLTVDLIIATAAAKNHGIVACMVGTTDFIQVDISIGASLRLYVGANSRGSYVAALGPATYALKLVKSGNNLEVFLDGTSRITYSLTGSEIATYASQTQHGLYGYDGTTNSWDNFKITTP